MEVPVAGIEFQMSLFLVSLSLKVAIMVFKHYALYYKAEIPVCLYSVTAFGL